MKSLTFSCIVNLPAEKIDLYEWLVNISEKDYQRFAKGHRAIGMCKKDSGEGMINVESIGGNLLVQHYTIVEKHRNKTTLVSDKSEAYLFHIIRVHVGVEWKMSITYGDESSCLFTCEIAVHYPNAILKLAATLAAGNYFIRKHLDEEGKHFAEDIEQKFRNR